MKYFTLAMALMITPVHLFADITWTEHPVETNYNNPWSAFGIDMDDDDDMDIVASGRLGHNLSWWENDGSENFTKHTVNGALDGAIAVFAIDIDGDTDVDVLSAARDAGEVAWWENDLIGIEEDVSQDIEPEFSIPTILEGPLRLPTGTTYRIFDVSGRQISLSNMKTGVYFIEIDGAMACKIIKIR